MLGFTLVIYISVYTFSFCYSIISYLQRYIGCYFRADVYTNATEANRKQHYYSEKGRSELISQDCLLILRPVALVSAGDCFSLRTLPQCQIVNPEVPGSLVST